MSRKTNKSMSFISNEENVLSINTSVNKCWLMLYHMLFLDGLSVRVKASKYRNSNFLKSCSQFFRIRPVKFAEMLILKSVCFNLGKKLEKQRATLKYFKVESWKFKRYCHLLH